MSERTSGWKTGLNCRDRLHSSEVNAACLCGISPDAGKTERSGGLPPIMPELLIPEHFIEVFQDEFLCICVVQDDRIGTAHAVSVLGVDSE